MIQQLLPQLRRKIGFGVVEKRGNVVLQRALAPTLIVEEKRLSVAQHDIARLEIPIQKVVPSGTQKESRQTAEIVLQRLLAERNARQTQKVVIEIIQIPRNGLPIKAPARITHLVIQIAARLNLKPRQCSDHCPVGFDYRGGNPVARPMLRKKLEERRIP